MERFVVGNDLRVGVWLLLFRSGGCVSGRVEGGG